MARRWRRLLLSTPRATDDRVQTTIVANQERPDMPTPDTPTPAPRLRRARRHEAPSTYGLGLCDAQRILPSKARQELDSDLSAIVQSRRDAEAKAGNIRLS